MNVFHVTENGEDVGFEGDYTEAVEELNKIATWYFEQGYENESVAVEGNYAGWVCRKGVKVARLAIGLDVEESMGKLNDIMEIDHVVRVLPNSEVVGTTGIYAPSLLDDELDDSMWEFFSTGYTGQDSYSGPIMHDSEFIGGQLERDILESPGIYAAIAAYYSPDDEDDELIGEGWAVVKLADDI